MRSATEKESKAVKGFFRCWLNLKKFLTGRSGEKRTVHGHLVDLRRVVLLDITQDSDVIVLYEVYGHTLPAEPTRSSDSASTSSNDCFRKTPDTPMQTHVAGSCPTRSFDGRRVELASPVNVQLAIVRKVVVDDEGDLLHVDSSRPHVSRDQHPATTNQTVNLSCWRTKTQHFRRRVLVVKSTQT